jgi:hypothetical protein
MLNAPGDFAARANTIIALGPVKGQYWSMPGLCDGTGCEVDQILNAGIITPKQFHGVVSRRDICKANMATYPKSHWHCGNGLEGEEDPGRRPRGSLSRIATARLYDFLQVIEAYPYFRPGLVNADLLANADQASDYVARLLYMLTPHPNAKAVVTFVIECRGYRTTLDHVVEELLQQQPFRFAVREGWTHRNRCYVYPDTGHTVKGTFVFQHRRTHQASKDPS